MSKINYINIDLDELDDDLFDELYEDHKKGPPKFKEDPKLKIKKKSLRRENKHGD